MERLKSNAGIAGSPWWKPADAAVGPALAKVEAAKAKWKADKVYGNAESYCIALIDLNEGLRSF